jgi:purple acid phosphatase-like protein/cytochrome c
MSIDIDHIRVYTLFSMLEHIFVYEVFIMKTKFRSRLLTGITLTFLCCLSVFLFTACNSSSGGSDNTPPEITNVKASDITKTSVIITWDTNENADSKVVYGKTSSYGQEVSNASRVKKHSVAIVNLESTTLYHYKVISSDKSGNETESADGTFTTTDIPDVDPPVISNINVIQITTGSASITWETNEQAISLVRYGQTQAYGLTSSSSMLVTEHSLTLTGLAQETEYHFMITSADALGNTASSDDDTFLTLAGVDITPPIIANSSISDIGTDYAVITWDTDEAATSVIWYGLTDSYGLTASSNMLETIHSLTLADLADGTEYHYKILSADAFDNLAQTSDKTFYTLWDDDLTPPVISNITVENISSDSAIINWDTDEDATSVVLYGPTTAYGLSSSSQMLVTGHSIQITGLDSATGYHFRIRSADVSGNTNLSDDLVFTTLTQAAVSYSQDIQPLFNANCTFCHGINGGLSLTSYQGVIAGGNSGQVVISGDPDSSLAIQKLENPSDAFHNDRLSEAEIEIIRNWIQEGILNN